MLAKLEMWKINTLALHNIHNLAWSAKLMATSSHSHENQQLIKKNRTILNHRESFRKQSEQFRTELLTNSLDVVLVFTDVLAKSCSSWRGCTGSASSLLQPRSSTSLCELLQRWWYEAKKELHTASVSRPTLASPGGLSLCHCTLKFLTW